MNENRKIHVADVRPPTAEPEVVKTSEGAWFSVHQNNGGFDRYAGVTEAAVEHIAGFAGILTDDQRQALKTQLWHLLIERARIYSGRKELANDLVTRSQLKKELSKLRRDALSGKKFPIPTHLKHELHSLERRRRAGLPFGVISKEPSSPEELQEHPTIMRDADLFVESCFSDPHKLAALIEDVLKFLRHCAETRDETEARRSAHQPDRQLVFDWVFRFWTETLLRPPSVTKKLAAFCDQVLQLNGFQLKDATIRQQLNYNVKEYSEHK